MEKNNLDWKKYLIVLLITAFLFLTASYLSNYFSGQKINQLKKIQDKIAIDILSSETQFSLLSEMSCKNISDSVLSSELEELGNKLSWSEENLGATEEVFYLKKYYSLLQIKDYLLMKKAEDKCDFKTTSIIYFYSTEDACKDCAKQGYILTDIRQNYPNVRVYAFDYNLDISALDALKTIYKVTDGENLPALVVNGRVYYGLQEFEDIQAIVPDVFVVEEKALEDDADTKDETNKEEDNQ